MIRRALLPGVLLIATVLSVLLVVTSDVTQDVTTDAENGNDSPPAWADCSAPRAHARRPTTAAAPPAALTLEFVGLVDEPTAAAAFSDRGVLVTLRKFGVVQLAADGKATELLDLRRDLSITGEQGVLGLALQPDRRALFVSYTAKDGAFTLERYPLVPPDLQPNLERGQIVLSYPDGNAFHNGGHLVFGPDGMLYVSLGDGGDDNFEGDLENDAQSLASLFGKILRLDVVASPGQYVVPNDNPFVGRRGARPEIWAYGMRNPWRFSFDSATGDMWVSDVGHFCWEEIDVIPHGRTGANLGWNRFEGSYEFRSTSAARTGLVWPVYEYPHVPSRSNPTADAKRRACAVIGGALYRGSQIPELRGWYVYSDVCSGAVFALRVRPGGGVELAELAEMPVAGAILSLAQDSAEAILVLTEAGVFRLVRQ